MCFYPIRHKLFKGSLIILFGLISSCVSYKPYEVKVTSDDESDVDYSILFYSGSHHKTNTTKGFKELNRQLSNADALLILGNISPNKGVPDSTAGKEWRQAQKTLEADVNLINNFQGETYILPGLNEWAGGRASGYSSILNFQSYLQGALTDSVNVFPANGCAGPVEVEISPGIVALFIDTQWFLHPYEKPDPTDCGMEDNLSYIIALEDAIRRNERKKVIVVGYHPIFSNGKRGGYLHPKYHFFPPVLGSIYAWYKSKVGGPQDLNDFNYRAIRSYLKKLFSTHSNLIYLSSHESASQHFEYENVNYLTSGALHDRVKVAKDQGESFAQGTEGFGSLKFYKNGDVYVEFWDSSLKNPTRVYRKKLFNHIYSPAVEDLDKFYADINYEGQYKNAVATTKLEKKQKKPGMLGNNYRKEWGTEMRDVRVFDIRKEKGGLKILKKGGGLQTKSLRLEDSTGKQYGLRSIEKFPDKAVPEALRGTVVGGLVSDQVSASHPYGAFVIPDMAEAAGVYHTNPELVYLPNDPRLGKYREDFGDGLYLFEERPAGDEWKDSDFFGNPDDIISTFDLIEKLQKNDKHIIDEDHVLRSRLFDIFIGDWDRHEDQWRWAKYDIEDDKKLYRPIPRDRDQAFFWSDGNLIKFASHKWGIPKFQGFHDEIRDVEGLEFNARFFDRTFLIQKTKEEWVKMAKEIQTAVTDEVIEKAIRKWPEEIYSINGLVIEEKLKRRRDDLVKYANHYYAFLAEKVDIVGSDKAELFEVKRLNDEQTEVTVFRIKEKSGDIKFKSYTRVFNSSETREIRLFGLGDDDRFNLSGEVNKGIKIRIIGGKGKDKISDVSKVKGIRKRNVLYDTEHGTVVDSGKELKIRTSDTEENINQYNRKAFKYDVLSPALAFGFNPDDGIYFGGGFTIMNHGFRKTPFAMKHTATISLAPRSGSYEFRYRGTFAQVLGKWNAQINLDVLEPSYGDFFYGFGNKSREIDDLIDNDRQFYNARYTQWVFGPSIVREINKIHRFEIGGFFRRVDLTTGLNDEEPNRFITQYEDEIGLSDDELSLFDNARWYVGPSISYSLDNTNLKGYPSRGLRWNVSAKAINQLGDEENNYQAIESDISTFITLAKSGQFKVVLAQRLGGGVNFGDFEFFQAQRLGGVNFVRGFAKARFTGDEKVFSNTELRVKLADLRTPVFPVAMGIHGLFDLGRVWTDQEDIEFRDDSISTWHRGYGGGLWISPFLGQIVLSTEIAFNDEEDSAFYVRVGFIF
ncbi:MAG: BamA/TamA family outer membrane protein [Bacteroidota bacterium]